MKVRKKVVILLTMLMLLTISTTQVFAALPNGVLQVQKVGVDGNTRNPDWMDAKTGIITLPQGEAFDNGGANHGVFHLYSDVKAGDTFYVYWVLNVEENSDLDDSDVILSQDPAWLRAYTAKGEGEEEVNTGPNGYLLEDDYDTVDFYYEDATPGKWQIMEAGFLMENEEVNHVQHRLHYRNLTGVQVKYLVVTSKKMNFAVDPATGEIDGVTNDKAFIEVTPSPTPEKTATPTPAPATPTPEKTAAPTPTSTLSASAAPSTLDNEGLSTGVVIAIAAAAVIIVGGGIFLAVKRK